MLSRTCRLVVPISSHVTNTNHVSTSFLLKGKNVKQIISIIRTPVDLHYKEQQVLRGYEFHEHGWWSLPGWLFNLCSVAAMFQYSNEGVVPLKQMKDKICRSI